MASSILFAIGKYPISFVNSITFFTPKAFNSLGIITPPTELTQSALQQVGGGDYYIGKK